MSSNRKPTLGEIAYNAWTENQKNLFGLTFSPYAKLSPPLRARWEAVGLAVGTTVIAAYEQRYRTQMPLFSGPPKPADIATLTL